MDPTLPGPNEAAALKRRSPSSTGLRRHPRRPTNESHLARQLVNLVPNEVETGLPLGST